MVPGKSKNIVPRRADISGAQIRTFFIAPEPNGKIYIHVVQPGHKCFRTRGVTK
jgi:hypothetical protein